MLALSLSHRCSRLSSGDSGFRPYGVFGAETDEAALGQSVTLHSGVEEYHQISWWLEKSNIARCRVNTPETRSCEITDEGLRDRLKTDNQTGSLSIINISTGLAGLYKLQIISSSKNTSYKEFSVTVSEAGLEPDHTQLKWGVLGLLVLVGVVIYCCCCRKAGGNDHTGDVIAQGLKEMLAVWDLKEEQQVCVTTDNAANIVNTVAINKWSRLQCFGHSLHLAIEHALKDGRIERALNVCKKVVERFSYSWRRRRESSEAQKELKLPQHKLKTECPTRQKSQTPCPHMAG